MRSVLTEYGLVLRSRWRWVAWGMLLALAATTIYLIADPPVYRSEATAFVRTPGDVSSVLDGGNSYAIGRARTYAVLANSTGVAASVVDDLGLDITPEELSSRIHATNPTGTALIDFVVSAPSAGEAQRIATVFLDEYSTTVRGLEAVPGSLVPRADLVVVNPPSSPVRTVAGGLPIAYLLLGAALIGLVVGALGAVTWSIFVASEDDPMPPHYGGPPGARPDNPGLDEGDSNLPANTGGTHLSDAFSITDPAESHHRHRLRRSVTAQSKVGPGMIEDSP